jgi:hypothetical protein
VAGLSAAERQRRSRAHRKGNHSLCDPASCEAAQDVTEPAATPAPVTPPPAAVTMAPPADVTPEAPHVAGEIEVEVAEFVGRLEFDEDDPRRILGRIAVKLARRVDAADATAGAVRQLTVLLAQLAEVPDQPAGPLDGTRARSTVRRLGSLIRAAS